MVYCRSGSLQEVQIRDLLEDEEYGRKLLGLVTVDVDSDEEEEEEVKGLMSRNDDEE